MKWHFFRVSNGLPVSSVRGSVRLAMTKAVDGVTGQVLGRNLQSVTLNGRIGLQRRDRLER